jgi:hypothetical protein
MGILLLLKEGGSLGIDTIGNLPIDEDLDLLPDSSGQTLSFRTIMESLSLTSTGSGTKARAIVMSDS